MKNIILIFSLCLISCDNRAAKWAEKSQAYKDELRSEAHVYVSYFEGHTYIKGASGGFLHAESCPCKNKKREE